MSEPSPSPETQPEIPESPVTVEAAEAPADGQPDATLSPLEVALAEVAQWKDLAYRNAAELDNFRKRTTREAQETRAFANADLLRSLFPILDNFEMGLEAARAESEKSMIFMGMNMVHRQITDFLREQGVQEVEALGKPFDPNLHDAVSQEITPGTAEGTILRVTRRGYKLKDRLLRAASVIVAGAPAPAETTPAA
ncbi:nucleotide exchange factor GrpE [Prosthecobacter dejongeii]|uniref:Protein GrpE n=1 Tax=Prosthecobacter dejongeii TaxID=48465 RepID=A0A7W7YH30_9BACT|nr:nucleotide exchange factor GrpE [Prosthecobacter dejongeii]MBB5036022.1 molecular chaperone GrpE [Prosthecobacter dejongeii]